MKIHTHERLWLAASLILTIAMNATVTYGAAGVEITMIGDDEPPLAPDDIDEDDRFEEPRVEQVGEERAEYTASAASIERAALWGEAA